jgi:hypothetical protein
LGNPDKRYDTATSIIQEELGAFNASFVEGVIWMNESIVG